MDSTITVKDDREYSLNTLIEKIRKHPLLTAIFLFILIKVLILFIFIWLFEFFNKNIGDINSVIFSNNIFFDLLGTRWDSYFYMIVADNGSYFDPNRPIDTRIWNFGPLYPFFTRLLMDFTNLFHVTLPVVIAGVLVSNFFSLTSLIAFFYMSRRYLNEIKAVGATLLFSFFPTVFVFSTVAYAESVFITFAILSWYFFEKENYPLSGLTLALATLARFPGAIIFILYIPIYFGRKIQKKGLKLALGSLLAIPVFPILVIIKFMTLLGSYLNSNSSIISLKTSFFQKFPISESNKENYQKVIDFLDIGLSWVLIFGIIPLGWIIFANAVAPMSLSEITFVNWGAKFVFPFAGLYEMVISGNIKWALEKYLFVFFFIGLGMIAIIKKPGISLLIIGQVLFYTGYTGVHAWGAPRYIGTIFLGPVILADELKSNKMIILVIFLFIIYGFIVLWQFCDWDNWLI